jgi:hypothetical protein
MFEKSQNPTCPAILAFISVKTLNQFMPLWASGFFDGAS